MYNPLTRHFEELAVGLIRDCLKHFNVTEEKIK
jgi:hypothetical protein